MSDWPGQRFHKPVIGTLSAESIPGVRGSAAVPASGAWPGANRALYLPFKIDGPYLVQRLWWWNGAAVSGNVDCGIYAEDGTRLTSVGSTAQANTNVVQSAAITPLLLPVGRYYKALAVDNTTATFFRYSPGIVTCIVMGMAQQASAFALPAVATFATVAQTYVPIFGISSAGVV